MMKIFIIFRFLFSTLWTWEIVLTLMKIIFIIFRFPFLTLLTWEWEIVLTLMQTIFRFPFTTLSTWAAVSTLTATSRFQIAIKLSPDCPITTTTHNSPQFPPIWAVSRFNQLFCLISFQPYSFSWRFWSISGEVTLCLTRFNKIYSKFTLKN